MKTKLMSLALGTIAASVALTGCETAPTGTNNVRVNGTTVANNTAVVVNSNTNMAAPMNSSMPANRWANANSVTREQYDKERAQYEAEKGTSTIGQGANDSWIWFKTRAALTTTNDLRDSTINVDVANDVTTLKGTVATAAQKTKAVEVAKAIDGVKSVKDELKVAAADSITNMNTNSVVNGNMNSNVKK